MSDYVTDRYGTEVPEELDGVDLLNADECPNCGDDENAWVENPAGYYTCPTCQSTWAGGPDDAGIVNYQPNDQGGEVAEVYESTATLTPTAVQDYFDQDGRHPGVYALLLADPGDDPEAIADAWLDHFDAHPPAGFSERAADASRLVYVGSHGRSVYERVMQHAEGEQPSTLMDVWPPVEIVGTWPEHYAGAGEYNRAAKMADEDTAVWMDGNYL